MSVGIIGGADGPIAVFIASPADRKTLLRAVLVVAGAIIALILMLRRDRKAKR